MANRTFHDVEPESTTTIEPIHLKNKIAKSNTNIFNVVYRMIIMILSSIAIYDQLLKMYEEEKASLEKKEMTKEQIIMKEFRAKILLLGDESVGKTSLIKRYVKDSFSNEYRMTIGLDVFTTEVILDRYTITLSIFDIAGQDKFEFMRKTFYHGASGALVVFDLTRYPTFNPSMVNWLKELWTYTGRIPTVLIGNKVDLADLRNVRQTDAQAFADKSACKYIETSAKTGEQVNHAFHDVATAILNQMPQSQEKT